MLEADAVRLTVEDRATASRPKIDRVWEKFYRVARDGRVKEEESTGLGPLLRSDRWSSSTAARSSSNPNPATAPASASPFRTVKP